MPKLTFNSSPSCFILWITIRFLIKCLLTVYNITQIFCTIFHNLRWKCNTPIPFYYSVFFTAVLMLYILLTHSFCMHFLSSVCIYISFHYLTNFAAICWPSVYEIVCVRTYLGRTTWGSIGNKLKIYSVHKRCMHSRKMKQGDSREKWPQWGRYDIKHFSLF